MSAAIFSGVRFDGRTALAQEVDVRIDGETLAVAAKSGIALERVRIALLDVSERFAGAPRIIMFRRGVTLEIPDPDGALDRALAAAGKAATPVQRMQRHWPAAVVALAGLAATLAWAYFAGVPAAAAWLAPRLPAGLEQRIGTEVLRELDSRMFTPSTLPDERRAAIVQRFAGMASAAAPQTSYRLEFRHLDGKRGVNAMALPGGTMIVLDGLVELVRDDDALMGVLAHELGHVAHQHSLRSLLQAMGVGALAGVVWGDFSSVVANVPLAFGILRYSRAFEREADDFAIDVLKANGVSTHPLADFFRTLEQRNGPHRKSSVPEFLSTHPASEERRVRLREAGNDDRQSSRAAPGQAR